MLKSWREWWLLALSKSARHTDITRFQLVFSHTLGYCTYATSMLKLPIRFQSARADQNQGVRKELNLFIAVHRVLPTVAKASTVL